MPQELTFWAIMSSTSIIAPVDISAISVLIIGSILAGFTQMLVLFVTSEAEKDLPSGRRFWANVGIGAMAGFAVGTWFLSLQTNAVPVQTVLMYQALSGFLGLEAISWLTGLLFKIRSRGGNITKSSKEEK